MRLTLRFLIVGFVLLGVSCNQSGVGILQSIRNEESYLDTSLDNDLTILSFDVLPNYYIAVTGELQVRPSSQTGSDIVWAAATLPTGDFFVTSAAVFAGVLYVTGSDRAGVTGTLYQFDPDADPGWTTIDVDSDPATDTGIIKVLSYSGGILVTSEDPDVQLAYNAFVSSDGSTFTELIIPAETIQVVDVAEYGGNYWVIAGNTLYVGGAGSLVAVVAVNSPGDPSLATEEGDLVGIEYVSDIGAVLVLAGDGTLYAFDGTNWLGTTPESVSIPGRELATSGFRATAMSHLAAATGERIVLIGTDSGYRELVFPGGATLDETSFGSDDAYREPGGTDLVSTSGTDYSIVDLRSSAVLGFALDGNLLFVATAGTGLWRTDISETERRWSRE